MENLQLISPPRTIMEVFKMLPEGTLSEVINDNLYMSPAPTTKHQRTVKKLALSLSDYIENKNLGEVFFAPFDVYLDEDLTVVEPDILLIPTSKMDLLADSGFFGVPELIVEVIILRQFQT